MRPSCKHRKADHFRCAVCDEAELATLRDANAKQSETIDNLRSLLARVYRAAEKEHWEEGETIIEVMSDVSWEGIAVPELEAEMAKDGAK